MISLAEPGTEYLLRNPDAFESGKEARSFLFTDRYLQAMLIDTNQDSTFAQAAKTAVAAAAARVPRRSNARCFRVDQLGSTFPSPRYDTGQIIRSGIGGGEGELTEVVGIVPIVGCKEDEGMYLVPNVTCKWTLEQR